MRLLDSLLPEPSARCQLPALDHVYTGASVPQQRLAQDAATQHSRGVGGPSPPASCTPLSPAPLSQGRCPVGSGLPTPWPLSFVPHSCFPKFLGPLSPPWSCLSQDLH